MYAFSKNTLKPETFHVDCIVPVSLDCHHCHHHHHQHHRHRRHHWHHWHHQCHHNCHHYDRGRKRSASFSANVNYVTLVDIFQGWSEERRLGLVLFPALPATSLHHTQVTTQEPPTLATIVEWSFYFQHFFFLQCFR